MSEKRLKMYTELCSYRWPFLQKKRMKKLKQNSKIKTKELCGLRQKLLNFSELISYSKFSKKKSED